ncbi:MAG: hypothetical protein JJU29_23545 [Verrucomicrobia bacterium]|nr:hypothetical protein [Verrucomicrobiota bacterium]
MKRKTNAYNPKRKLADTPDESFCHALTGKVNYGGNPEHKRNPGDFGLEPPSAHHKRPDKAMCDSVEILKKKRALQYLKSGAKKGVFSAQMRGDFPQNIWAVMDDGTVLEAQLENQTQGTYHGYPLEDGDPIVDAVRKRWEETS